MRKNHNAKPVGVIDVYVQMHSLTCPPLFSSHRMFFSERLGLALEIDAPRLATHSPAQRVEDVYKRQVHAPPLMLYS